MKKTRVKKSRDTVPLSYVLGRDSMRPTDIMLDIIVMGNKQQLFPGGRNTQCRSVIPYFRRVMFLPPVTIFLQCQSVYRSPSLSRSFFPFTVPYVLLL
jgi:hypothetical protein